jgi:hypothetical protein
VIDVIDDVCESSTDAGFVAELQLLRHGALDLLHDVRRLEAGLPPRDFSS